MYETGAETLPALSTVRTYTTLGPADSGVTRAVATSPWDGVAFLSYVVRLMLHWYSRISSALAPLPRNRISPVPGNRFALHSAPSGPGRGKSVEETSGELGAT
ncbi:hypothetical protein GCM10020254_21510 [Streptomyces goshikiensis]